MTVHSSFNSCFIYLLLFTLSVNKTWSKDYRTVCGDRDLIAPTGTIISPFYPDSFPFPMRCKWYILSPPQSILKIHIEEFNVPDDPGCEESHCCLYNYLSLPVSGKPDTYQKLCGNISQSLITVKQNHTTISFQYYGSATRLLHQRRGFKLSYTIGSSPCAEDEIPCNPSSRHCFNLRDKCDGLFHCPFGEDEKGCSDNCKFGIKCRSGETCYLPAQRCDGHPDCLDESDESMCTDDICPLLPNKRLCRNGHCIDSELWCNGIDDCGDNSDEQACIKNSVITIAMMGALLGGLFLVLAVGCGLRVYSRRYSHGSSHQLHLSPPSLPRLRMPHSLSLPALIDNEFFHREPPPMYSVAVGNAGLPRRSRINRSRGSSRRSNHPFRSTVAVPVPKPPSENTLNDSSSSPSSEDSLVSSSNCEPILTDDNERLISA